MITEVSIKSAIKDCLASGKKSTELKDGGERGAGRLALIIRVNDEVKDGIPTKTTTTEWYAVWHRSGRRRLSKIGNYPSTPLAEARKTFRDRYAGAIGRGEDPTGPRARRDKAGITIKHLFEAYVANLKQSGAASWRHVERALLGPKGNAGAAQAIGPDLAAGAVTAEDITPYLKKIYDRGAVTMADGVRVHIGAAFSFGIKSKNDYRQATNPDWDIKSNPAVQIPAGEKTRGMRYLAPIEFRTFWRWLETRDSVSVAAPASRILMSCGQRITEILRVDEPGYDSLEKIIDWEKTKNKKQHAIPVPRQAVAIFEMLPTNQHGLYFPSPKNPKKPLTAGALLDQIYVFIEETGAKPFTTRDIRRTWKTLSGAAGIQREIRDRIQNHALHDVGSVHYDRWDYMPEKRAAMATWADYLDRILSGELDNDIAHRAAAEAIAAEPEEDDED